MAEDTVVPPMAEIIGQAYIDRREEGKMKKKVGYYLRCIQTYQKTMDVC